MKNKKVELDLETVLRIVAQLLLVLLASFAGISLLLGHLASVGQVLGGFLLLFAVYLLMPTKEPE